MDFNLTPEEEAFRDEVRDFLDENLVAEDQELLAELKSVINKKFDELLK